MPAYLCYVHICRPVFVDYTLLTSNISACSNVTLWTKTICITNQVICDIYIIHKIERLIMIRKA